MEVRLERISISLIWIVLTGLAVACTPQPSVETDTQPAKVSKSPTAATIREAPSQLHTEPKATELAQFELLSISARTWTALPGERLCVDESSMKRTCAEVTQSTFASSGSLYLGVQVEVKNLGQSESSFALGQLIANYSGRTYRYERLERSDEGQSIVQPLATTSINGSYEVPIEVLNDAAFVLDVGASDPIKVTFDTPAMQEQQRAANEALAAARNAEAKAADLEEERLYQKCWALNDDSTPLVSREGFDWYVESCSHMYDVGSYEMYLARRIRRSG